MTRTPLTSIPVPLTREAVHAIWKSLDRAWYEIADREEREDAVGDAIWNLCVLASEETA